MKHGRGEGKGGCNCGCVIVGIRFTLAHHSLRVVLLYIKQPPTKMKRTNATCPITFSDSLCLENWTKIWLELNKYGPENMANLPRPWSPHVLNKCFQSPKICSTTSNNFCKQDWTTQRVCCYGSFAVFQEKTCCHYRCFFFLNMHYSIVRLYCIWRPRPSC